MFGGRMKRGGRSVVAALVMTAVGFVAMPLAAERVLAPVDVPLVDPRGAMRGFHEALKRTRTKAPGNNITRVLFLGDSAVVSDGLTGSLRRILQLRYGDAGAGFLAVGRPWAWYRHRAVRHDGSGWEYEGVHNRLNGRERGFGLAFLRAEARGLGSRATFATSSGTDTGGAVGRFEVFYLEQPRGGSFAVRVDGGTPREVNTRSERRRAAYLTLEVADGAHELSVESLGKGPVTIFGVAMERARAGVVVDAIGVNGAHATHMLANDPSFLREHLAHRKPDLIAVQLGTNLKNRMPIRNYAAEMRTLLTQLRAAVPGASCLLVTPYDRTTLPPDDAEPTPPYIPKVALALADVARDTGCAYWSAFESMGGVGSFRRWQRAGLSRADGMHLSHEGYDLVAERFAHALLAGAP
jgi:lysophospholipase L1-like esterase